MPTPGTDAVTSSTLNVPVPVPLAGVTRIQAAVGDTVHVTDVVEFCVTRMLCAGVVPVTLVPERTAPKLRRPRFTDTTSGKDPSGTNAETSTEAALCTPARL